MSAGGPPWRPSATLEALRARAALLARIRAFFAARGVLEVETPVLAAASATDLHLASLETVVRTAHGPRRLFLQTSPEFAMKRLLAAGSGPVYQIARAFRDAEAGRFHNPEFTLLEWYRPGFDERALMDEVDALVAELVPGARPSRRIPYREALRRHAGIDPWTASPAALVARCRELGLAPSPVEPSPDECLDFLVATRVQPALGPGGTFVYDFPASQAALARVRPGNPPVAERFELYLDGVELANGYRELADAREQRRRQERDRAARRRAGLADVPVDERLLAALEHGLPECSGVALGVDRLAMAALGARALEEVIPFPIERA